MYVKIIDFSYKSNCYSFVVNSYVFEIFINVLSGIISLFHMKAIYVD